MEKQGKKVCKPTALRCYQCCSLHLMLFLASRANWLEKNKSKKLHWSFANYFPWRSKKSTKKRSDLRVYLVEFHVDLAAEVSLEFVRPAPGCADRRRAIRHPLVLGNLDKCIHLRWGEPDEMDCPQSAPARRYCTQVLRPSLHNEQGKMVSKPTAFRCHQCFSLPSLLALLAKPNCS